MTESIDRTAEVVRDLAFEATHAQALEPGEVYAWFANGGVHKIDLTGDQYRDNPRRKTGTVFVRNVDSFKIYYGKHQDEDSDVFADLDGATVTAVLDAHTGDEARWQEHRLVLALQHTLPWKTWLANDRKMLPQQDFAEFLEDNAADIAPAEDVTAADLLEVAQTFQAHTQVKFTSGKRLASGQTQLIYAEEVDARAGDRGEIKIPAEFYLAIVPFEDCDAYRVRARFRYRIHQGDLLLGYFLDDPQRKARDAVDQITGKIAAACDVPVMHGRPV
jgi:uncharacterized protein YfdQ (DUF2303 family)